MQRDKKNTILQYLSQSSSFFGQYAKMIQYIMNLIGIAVFCIGSFVSSLEYMMAAILICIFVNITYALFTMTYNMPYFLFLLSFFCFLLGRIGVGFMTTGSVEMMFSADSMKHILLLIFLAVISLQIGAEMVGKYNNRAVKREAITKDSYSEDAVRFLESITRIAFFISCIAAIAMNLEVFLYIRNNSYVETFTSFKSSLPAPVQIVGGMYLYLFAILLGTCPDKNRCIFPITVFAFVTGTGLLTGDRGGVILNVCMVLVYIFWRQKKDGQTWISKKAIICGIALIPVVMAAMSYFVYLREGIDIGDRSFGPQLARFFRSAGKSVRVLGYGKEHIEEFPQSLYSIGGIIDYFKYNSLSRQLFDISDIPPHTVDYATTMHAYAHALTYLVDPEVYLAGHGFGSSYLAEVYHDFGYIGAVLVNILFGGFLSYFNRIKSKNPFTLALLLLLVRGFYYIPRGSATFPITSVLSLTLFVVFIWCYIAVKYKRLVLAVFEKLTIWVKRK